MCGIAGLLNNKIIKEEVTSVVEKMIDAVIWRGPDDKGVQTVKVGDSIIGLAHRRLSILDLSNRGHQPMGFADGRYTIVYNGEIYNYKTIREELTKKGHVFMSDCDTEVVLHACAEYGVNDAVSKFNGMWAFAFVDKDRGVITLSRDRLGVKPLYYTYADFVFSFSSDIRSFYEIPDFKKDINQKALHGYLWNMYIPAPYSIIDGVFKIPPGCNLEYNIENGEIRVNRYWNARNIKQVYEGEYKDYVSEIETLLTDSVKLRLEADVPVGVFLSGGIDSSVVSALAQKESNAKINTYSIGFDEKENDDAEVASQVAKILGTNHKELYCTQQDALNIIESIPDAFAEPFADNSQIPTMLLSRMTREHVTVALSGDGGDELFLGYPIYISRNALFEKRSKLGITAILGNAAAKILPLYNHNRWRMEKFYNASSVTNGVYLEYITAHRMISSLFDKTEGVLEEIELYGGNYYEAEGLGMMRSLNLQSIEFGLSDDMLTKVDRASMFYSLECRCPILDYRVAEVAIEAPTEYNLHNGQLKAPLKDILYKYVPREIVERPKSGFGVPINKWIHSDLNEIVNDNLSSGLIKKQGVFSTVGIERFVKEFNKRKNPNLDRIAYSLLIFQLWWKRYLDI